MRQGFFVRHRGQVASVSVVLAAVGAVVGYALTEPGFSPQHAKINDGGVWVTNNRVGAFGRLNHPIEQFDGGTFVENPDSGHNSLDVLQDGSAVVGVDQADGSLYPIDDTTALRDSTRKVSLPGTSRVAMAAGPWRCLILPSKLCGPSATTPTGGSST